MKIIEKSHKKIKELSVHKYFDNVIWFAILIVLCLGSFLIGIYYKGQQYLEDNPISLEYDRETIQLWKEYQKTKNSLPYFGSKNGSMVYPIECSNGSRIKEENKVFFDSLKEGIHHGYKEGKSC